MLEQRAIPLAEKTTLAEIIAVLEDREFMASLEHTMRAIGERDELHRRHSRGALRRAHERDGVARTEQMLKDRGLDRTFLGWWAFARWWGLFYRRDGDYFVSAEDYLISGHEDRMTPRPIITMLSAMAWETASERQRARLRAEARRTADERALH